MKYTYFFLDRNTGLTKIGRTKYPEQRFKQLGGHRRLLIIAWICGDVERGMHETFAHRRVHGEWFSLSNREHRIVRNSDGFSQNPLPKIERDAKDSEAVDFDPSFFSKRGLVLILLRSQQWKVSPASAAARLLDDYVAKKSGGKVTTPTQTKEGE